MPVVLHAATFLLVALAGTAVFLLAPPEQTQIHPLFYPIVIGGSLAVGAGIVSWINPNRFLAILFRVKVLGDVSLRYYLAESLRLGGTLLAPLNLMVLLWCSGLTLVRRHRLAPYLLLLAPLAPFVIWQIVALGIRPSTGGLTKVLSQQWIPIILVATLVSNISTKDLRSILHGAQIMIAIMLTTVLTEWLFGWPTPVTAFDADVAWSQGRTIRFGGIWGIRSKGAEGWAEVSYIISLSALLLNRRQTTSFLHVTNIAFCAAVISLTGSKTPIVVLFICSVFLILLARNAIRGLMLSALMITTGAGLLVAGVFDGTLERFEAEQVRLETNTTRDGLGTGRVGTWGAALHNWRQDGVITVLVGGGLLSSVEFVNTGDRLGNEKDHGIHSQHLSILVELGVVGLAFYILFWIGLVRLLRRPDQFDTDDSFAQLVATGIMAGLLVRGMTADILNAVYYTWYLAIPIALLTKRRIERAQQYGSP